MRTKDVSAKIDPDNNYYMGEIPVLHDVIHQGKMHAISYRKQSVTDGGDLIMVISAGENKDVHARINFGGEGKTILESFVSPVFTGGVPYVPFNRQTKLTNNMESVYTVDPTVTDNGIGRGSEFLGSGGSPQQRAGGDSTNDLETVINAGTVLMLVVTNDRGNTSDLQITGAVYERSKFEG